MSEEYDLKPFTFKADKTKPARIVQKKDGSLEIWFYDEDGNLRKMPVIVSVLPGEVVDAILNNSLTSSLTGKLLEAQGLAPYPMTGKGLKLSGAWSVTSDIDAPQGIWIYSKDTATPAKATVAFRGTKFALAYKSYSAGGIANIYVDGSLIKELDTYDSIDHVEIYFVSGLIDGEHVLEIEVSGEKNPSSSNYYVSLYGLYFEASKNPVQDVDYFVRNIVDTIKNYLNDIRNIGLVNPKYSLLTSTPLGASASYTSGWDNAENWGFKTVALLAYSDVDSATDGMCIEQSDDQSTIIRKVCKSYTGGDVSGNLLTDQLIAKYVRFTYKNGSTAQSTFKLIKRYYIA